MKKIISLILMLIIVSNFMFAQTTSKTTPEPYTQEEFPGWVHDLRRAEIVTLGSLPFTTLLVTLGYQVYRYVDNDFSSTYFPNPLAKSSTAANLDEDEQIGILVSGLSLSLAVGLTDIIVNIIKRKKESDRLQNYKLPDNIEIKGEKPLPPIRTEHPFPQKTEE